MLFLYIDCIVEMELVGRICLGLGICKGFNIFLPNYLPERI
jgi:hypothetical protein